MYDYISLHRHELLLYSPFWGNIWSQCCLQQQHTLKNALNSEGIYIWCFISLLMINFFLLFREWRCNKKEKFPTDQIQKVQELMLYPSDRKSLIDCRRVSDADVTAGQTLLKEVYPQLEHGLQRTILGIFCSLYLYYIVISIIF